jgi:hypothetical protein
MVIMMNLLEAMRIFHAIVKRRGRSGVASDLKLDIAQVSARLDGLDRYLGRRSVRGRSGDDVVCIDAGAASYACCRRTPSAAAQVAGARGAGACATISGRAVAGFPSPEAIRRSDCAPIAAPALTTLHRPSR